MIADEAQRMKKIIGGLLEYARAPRPSEPVTSAVTGSAAPGSSEPSAVVRHVAALVAPQLKKARAQLVIGRRAKGWDQGRLALGAGNQAHGGFAHQAKVLIRWIASDECETPEGAAKNLADLDGICVPGGFGVRGIEGKLGALTYARENGLPALGQLFSFACVEPTDLHWGTAVIDFFDAHPRNR